jgi:hypothetical protein
MIPRDSRHSDHGSLDNDDQSDDNTPFLTLEENLEVSDDELDKSMSSPHRKKSANSWSFEVNGKKIVSVIVFSFIALVAWDAMFRDPANRWIRPDFSASFLVWVQGHPFQGLFAFLVVIATGVILMIPIGTPLTLGCGYIYKGAYGWKLGVAVATIISMAGSALGAVTCFLLGRYMMRDQVRKWIRKYPLFDAIDAGESKVRSTLCHYG